MKHILVKRKWQQKKSTVLIFPFFLVECIVVCQDFGSENCTQHITILLIYCSCLDRMLGLTLMMTRHMMSFHSFKAGTRGWVKEMPSEAWGEQRPWKREWSGRCQCRHCVTRLSTTLQTVVTSEQCSHRRDNMNPFPSQGLSK